MKGLVFLGDRNVALGDFDDPTPSIGEVVLQIKASGMCGSDLHAYRATQDASSGRFRPPQDPDLPLNKRTIGGHEPCGVVVAVGPGVPSHVAKVGDRAMVHHYHGCTVCGQCRAGWPQLCDPKTRTLYSVNAHGSHAEYMLVPASTLVPLHETLSYAAGAAIACGTGTAWGALERLQLSGDETIAVYGQGPVGLSVTMLAAARGARVIAIDIDERRLELAKTFGAVATINPSKVASPEAIRELNAGQGANMAVETSGSSDAAKEALLAVDKWGKVCYVGMGSQVAFDTWANLDRQLTLLTSYSMSIMGQKQCADFVVQRGLDLDRLFTDRWQLDQAQEAYAHFDQQSSGKGVFVF